MQVSVDMQTPVISAGSVSPSRVLQNPSALQQHSVAGGPALLRPAQQQNRSPNRRSPQPTQQFEVQAVEPASPAAGQLAVPSPHRQVGPHDQSSSALAEASPANSVGSPVPGSFQLSPPTPHLSLVPTSTLQLLLHHLGNLTTHPPPAMVTVSPPASQYLHPGSLSSGQSSPNPTSQPVGNNQWAPVFPPLSPRRLSPAPSPDGLILPLPQSEASGSSPRSSVVQFNRTQGGQAVASPASSSASQSSEEVHQPAGQSLSPGLSSPVPASKDLANLHSGSASQGPQTSQGDGHKVVQNRPKTPTAFPLPAARTGILRSTSHHSPQSQVTSCSSSSASTTTTASSSLDTIGSHQSSPGPQGQQSPTGSTAPPHSPRVAWAPQISTVATPGPILRSSSERASPASRRQRVATGGAIHPPEEPLNGSGAFNRSSWGRHTTG